MSDCKVHPDAGLTPWGACWDCYAMRHGGGEPRTAAEVTKQGAFWYHDSPTSGLSGALADLRTQGEVLSALLTQSDLIHETFGDLAVSDFVGSVHQSLFHTMLKLTGDGKVLDIATVAEAWGDTGVKAVGDAATYVAGLLDVHNVPLAVQNLRQRVDKLHRLSSLRRVRFMAEALQRHTDNVQAEPHELLQKLEIGIEALRAGYDLNGDLLPYAPRTLARRPELITLSSVEAKPVPWLWRPFLPYGMLSLLSGEPGCGKTFLGLAFAAALTVGTVPFTGEPCRPHDVVYLSIENSLEYCIRPRFDSLGGDASKFHALQGAVTGDGPKARREGVRLSDIPLLESALKQTGARFLVVDPIQSFLGADVDSHRSNETRPILDGLQTVAEKYGVCLLILRHFAKSTTGSAINRGLGSIDITGAARTELHAGKRDDQYILAQAKSNIGPFGPSLAYEIKNDIFRWTGESPLTANDLAQVGNLSEEDREAASEAMECLTDLLRGGPKLVNEILSEAKELGFSEKSVRRAKSKLGAKSRKRAGARHGQFEWYLDDYEQGEVCPS